MDPRSQRSRRGTGGQASARNLARSNGVCGRWLRACGPRTCRLVPCLPMKHEEVARQNFNLAPGIRQFDWRITILFYDAVHAANHVLFGGANKRGEYSHSQRTLDMERHVELRKIASRYRELK